MCFTAQILLIVLFSVFTGLSQGSLIVETTTGVVEGTNYTWKDGTLLNAWRGIPFAKPPINLARWRSPKPHNKWEHILKCDELKPSCIQPDGSGDENCLYLNIYSTASPKSTGLLPVLFYIYGGSLMSGAANSEYGAFVSHAGGGDGVVVVEVSYRLNILGFLASAELSAEQGGSSGNYGIQDQILALRWVHDNIQSFNGDPNLVTICGQSSGGTSVFALLSAPSAKGLFHRAISLSGSPNISLPMRDAETQNDHIVLETGCRSSVTGHNKSSAEVLACMRSMSPASLVKLIPDAWNTPGLFGLPLSVTGSHWEGLVIVDGVTIPFPFDKALAYGNVSSNVPFMIGAMGQEPDEWPDVRVQNYSTRQWRKYLVDYFAPWDALNRSARAEPVGETVYRLYEKESDTNPQKAFDSIQSDYGQSCANVWIAQQALPPLGRYSADIFHFVNQWHLSTEYTVDEGSYIVRNAFHVLDYLMVMEAWEAFDDGNYIPTQRDLEGATLQQNLWYSFMVTGRPTAGTKDAAEWKPVDETKGWPEHFNTYVIQQDEGAASGTVENYSRDKCTFFNQIGISHREFWWCN